MSKWKLNPREIQRAIRMLEGLDPKRASISDFEEHLTSLFRGYTVNAPRFEDGVYLYRGRKCEKPTNLGEISYPPGDSVIVLGRANDVGQTIFYGATTRATPFFELDAQPGEHIALSKWKTIGQMTLNHIGFSSEPESFQDTARNLDSVYNFVEETKAKGDLNALVHDYLSYNFSRQLADMGSDQYKLTNAISRKLFADDIFDGLLYPTIQMSGNADNIALKPDTVDRLLRFVNVEYVTVKEVRGTKMDIAVLDSSTQADVNGVLAWSGRSLQWALREQGEELSFAVEGGEYVAYDALGNRVDPE